MDDIKEEFYTARGYAKLLVEQALTPSMEDYLEMIFRLGLDEGYTRVYEIADALNVQPPSVSRMARKLFDRGLLTYEKYGIIKLTRRGKKVGKYLFDRHNTLREFLNLIGVKEDLHKEVEGIEHSVSPKTMDYINKFVGFFKKDETWIEEYRRFLNS